MLAKVGQSVAASTRVCWTKCTEGLGYLPQTSPHLEYWVIQPWSSPQISTMMMIIPCYSSPRTYCPRTTGSFPGASRKWYLLQIGAQEIWDWPAIGSDNNKEKPRVEKEKETTWREGPRFHLENTSATPQPHTDRCRYLWPIWGSMVSNSIFCLIHQSVVINTWYSLHERSFLQQV